MRGLVLDPSLAFGEAYMDGTLRPVECSIYDVLDVLTANLANGASAHPLFQLHTWLGVLMRRFAQFNPTARARRNVAAERPSRSSFQMMTRSKASADARSR